MKSLVIFSSHLQERQLGMMPVSIVRWRAKIGVFNARLIVKHLKLKYHRSICFSGSCHLYRMGCLFSFLLICAGDIELNLGPPKNKFFVIKFHGVN